MTETTTVQLTKPIKAKDGSEITEIEIREPQVGDLIKAESFKGQIAYTTAMLASITGIPIPVLETMRPADFDKVDRACGKLMGNFRGEGGGDSQS